MEIHVGWSASPTIEARPFQWPVAKGIALLNERCPGWTAKVNLKTLAAESLKFDVIGQVFNDYALGCQQLGLPFNVFAEEMVEYGFAYPENEPTPTAWVILTREWVRQIQELPKVVCEEEWLGRLKVETTGQVMMSGVCLGAVYPSGVGWYTTLGGRSYGQKIRAVESLLPDAIEERERLLATTQFVVEATDAEVSLLWEKFSNNSSRKGEFNCHDWDQLPCFCVEIGKFHGFPVNISCRWVNINGLRTMFYEPVSRVVDHDMVRAWLTENCNPRKGKHDRARTNTNNFSNVLAYSQQVEK